MLQPLPITIKESLWELRGLQKKYPAKYKVIEMLIILKQHGPMSKDRLAVQTGASDRSIHTWRKMYITGGIETLLKEKRGGKKPGAITPAIHKELSKRLTNPKEGFRSFIEIQQWLLNEFDITMEYHAVNKYVKRKFGAKLKVSRKSHVQKFPADKAVFKKSVRKVRTY